jgi:hypothetical protein
VGIALLVILGGFALIFGLAYWYSGRRRPPPPPPDLRRADDAQLQRMPTADEVADRISNAFGETEPLN